MMDPSQLYRHSLKYFVREVFRQLHPNTPPLLLTGSVRPMWHTALIAGSGVHETKIESKTI